MNYWGLVALPFGLFYLSASLCDWDWFFERGRQRRAVEWFGRQNARILYGLLGVVVIVMVPLAVLKLPPFQG